MYEYNSKVSSQGITDEALFDHMVKTHTLRIAIIIAGQGPEAFGMPEMAVPSFRINYHRLWRQLVSLITDGRYSGTNFGVSVGHVTPEAIKGGGILYLQTGDLVHMQFRAGRIDLIDPEPFATRGEIIAHHGTLARERVGLGAERRAGLEKRSRQVAPSNRMVHHTDASQGVIPQVIADWAVLPYKEAVPV
jgi:dihydroxyacid dehydratase/phosphogluconate dehydratase